MSTAIKIENLSKQYRLGIIGTGTISKDLNRWWAAMRGKPDPYLKIGEVNDLSADSGQNFVWALKDISFEVERGQALGIIGKNGAGKSTLLKILSRVTGPSTGSVKVKGRLASLLEVGTGFHPELTGRENVFLNGAIMGMSKTEIRGKFDEIVSFSGVDAYIDTPVKRYSSGMYVRLAFAVAAHLEPEILVVDEVLAVGDEEFQKKCLGKMKDAAGKGRTVLFVSHNMNAINRLCDHSILLENGMLTYSGTSPEVVSRYLNSFVAADQENEVTFEESSKYLQIREVKILGENMEAVKGVLDTNSKIYVSIKYAFARKISKLHLTVYFKNNNGEIVYFIDRAESVQKFATVEKGEYSSIIEIPNPLLSPGQYSVTFGCADNDGHENDHKFDALMMEISSSATYREEQPGFIYKPVTWELIKS